MTIEQIHADPRVQELKNQFIQKGFDFQKHIDEAIDKATSNIKNPQLESVVNMVVKELEKELVACIIRKGLEMLKRLKAKFFKKRNNAE